MITSLDAEKAYDRIEHPFLLKDLDGPGIQGSYLNIAKAIQSKLVANIKQNGDKFEEIPLKSGTRQAAPFLPIYSV